MSIPGTQEMDHFIYYVQFFVEAIWSKLDNYRQLTVAASLNNNKVKTVTAVAI